MNKMIKKIVALPKWLRIVLTLITFIGAWVLKFMDKISDLWFGILVIGSIVGFVKVLKITKDKLK